MLTQVELWAKRIDIKINPKPKVKKKHLQNPREEPRGNCLRENEYVVFLAAKLLAVIFRVCRQK